MTGIVGRAARTQHAGLHVRRLRRVPTRTTGRTDFLQTVDQASEAGIGRVDCIVRALKEGVASNRREQRELLAPEKIRENLERRARRGSARVHLAQWCAGTPLRVRGYVAPGARVRRSMVRGYTPPGARVRRSRVRGYVAPGARVRRSGCAGICRTCGATAALTVRKACPTARNPLASAGPPISSATPPTSTPPSSPPATPCPASSAAPPATPACDDTRPALSTVQFSSQYSSGSLAVIVAHRSVPRTGLRGVECILAVTGNNK
eukprot:1182124-Prorocentrum_minimum.AAC.2